MNEQTQLE